MKLTKKLKFFCTICVVFSLSLYLLYNTVVLFASKNFNVYSGTPVKCISTVSTRTSFVTNEGVYITGDYYHDLDTSVGLRGIKECAYKRVQTPVMIFEGYADDVILTSFGGFVTQNSKLYLFTIEHSKFKTPILIADNCLEPVNAFNFGEKGYCCLYVNNANELILKSIDQNWTQLCLENVIGCKYYSNGVYIILKANGSLWLMDAEKINNYNEVSKCTKITDNVKSFAYSSLSFGGQGEQNNFVLLSKDGKVYKKYGLNAPLEEVCDSAKDIGIYKQNIIVLTLDNKLEYYTNNGVKTKMDAENVEIFAVSDNIICAYSKTSGLLFWGENKYNSFGFKTSTPKIDLILSPAKWSNQSNKSIIDMYDRGRFYD